jgi:uncharacterized protein YxjI
VNQRFLSQFDGLPSGRAEFWYDRTTYAGRAGRAAIPSVTRPALHVRVRGLVQAEVPPVSERDHPQEAIPQLPARGIVGLGGCCAVRRQDDDGSVVTDMDGHELCKIQERMLHLRESMEIEGPDGNRMAMVHKAMITPLRERWIAKLEDGPDLHAQGNIVDHEYTIERDGTKAAEVSKRWFRIRDSYGVEIAPGENDILILATAAVIDTMAHPAR